MRFEKPHLEMWVSGKATFGNVGFWKRPFRQSGFWEKPLEAKWVFGIHFFEQKDCMPWNLKPYQAMSEMFLKLGGIPEVMKEYEAMRGDDNIKRQSNYARIAMLMKKRLMYSVEMQRVYDASFAVTSVVAERQADYDKSLCHCMNNLLLATAQHMLAETPEPKAPAGKKVIKHQTKLCKVEKGSQPKSIGITHVKNLFNFASARHSYNSMRRAGVAEAVAKKASGSDLVDIVPVHPASDDIWGPIV